MLKKILYTIVATIWIWISFWITTQQANAQSFWAWDWRDIWVVGVWANDDTPWTEPRALTIIRVTINWVLSILWVIALILCLYWWFLMLTAAGDDNKVKTWTKILKNAAIWLVIIWLSWIIVRFVFWLILEMNSRAW